MNLLTGELTKRLGAICSQEHTEDPIVVAKFFNPTGAGTWFATEYDPESRLFFGYASIFGDDSDEWGYFSLDELEAYRGPFGLGIERDCYWQEQPFSQAKRELSGSAEASE